jgi:two-component system sensor histidine kinase BarA
VNELSALELSMADVQRIEDLVDREALGEVCRSFFELFGLPIRVFSNGGALLADVHQQRSICTYVNGFDEGKSACVRTVNEVRKLVPEGNETIHACFTGAVYRVVPIHYDGRRLGRFVVGPYLPAELREVPRTLLQLHPSFEAALAKEHMHDMPRVRRETAERIMLHFSRVLDLILFSGHRAYLTSNMHLASVRANFRELAEKTQRLQQAYDKLKELDRLKSNFLATMSHELRTPLTSIIGYSEMLASGMGGELNTEQTEFVQTIRNKGDHLLELITSLLDMSKFEQGQLLLKREPLDVEKLLDDVLRTVTPVATKKNISLKRVLASDLPKITGDEARLRQVIQNLTDNAIKFTPAGGHITLEARAIDVSLTGDEASDDESGFVLLAASQRAVEFTVRDTGIGIPKDQLERIFDAFYQVDGSVTREHGGTGLGLSIVKKLVEAHGGKVRVESELAKGSAFFVIIPEADEPAMS